MLRSLREDPKKHVVLMRINLRSEQEFFDDISTAPPQGAERKALVFIHGYNNSFEDAARRTAQIAHDVEFVGVPMFYSWPSKAKTKDYIVDGNEVEQAVVYLKEFLRGLALNSRFDSITLIAHSMGNARSLVHFSLSRPS